MCSSSVFNIYCINLIYVEILSFQDKLMESVAVTWKAFQLISEITAFK